MKRRSFFHAAAAASAVAAAPLPAPAQSGPESPTAARAIEITAADSVCEPKTGFFTRTQMATMEHLAEILWPANGDNPGAGECGVAPFLDFLIGASPAASQQLYRTGLDTLDHRARTRFGKPFASLAAADSGKLLASLNDPWTPVAPTDPVARFLLRAKTDVQTATLNSRTYALKVSATRRSAAGIGNYWFPLD
jgi:hypothetical protein